MTARLKTTFLAALVAATSLAETFDADIVVYGSTPAAISAAVQAKRMGKSVIVVSPETRIGGMTTGGLGQSDVGNRSIHGNEPSHHCAYLYNRFGAPYAPATLKIDVKNYHPDHWRVKRVTLNGVELSNWRVRHADLVKGGELVFEMASEE